MPTMKLTSRVELAAAETAKQNRQFLDSGVKDSPHPRQSLHHPAKSGGQLDVDAVVIIGRAIALPYLLVKVSEFRPRSYEFLDSPEAFSRYPDKLVVTLQLLVELTLQSCLVNLFHDC